jgi:hypothetical protein
VPEGKINTVSLWVLSDLIKDLLQSKFHTHPLLREGVPHQEPVIFRSIEERENKSGHGPQQKAPHQDRRARDCEM